MQTPSAKTFDNVEFNEPVTSILWGKNEIIVQVQVLTIEIKGQLNEMSHTWSALFYSSSYPCAFVIKHF